MADHKPSRKAEDFWKRILSWYGARMADQFGAKPPIDWCEVIDKASAAVISKALGEIKQRHPVYPPTFPQFDAIVERFTKTATSRHSVQERLRRYVVGNRTLTATQLHVPWTYLYRDEFCVGVDVPRDGDTPGFRVRIEDLMANWDAQLHA